MLWFKLRYGPWDCITALVKVGNNKFASSHAAATSSYGTVIIWEDFQNLHTIVFSSGVLAMCVLLDRRLVVGCNNHELTVWDPHDFSHVATLRDAEDINLRFQKRFLRFAVLANNELVVVDGEKTRSYK